MPELEDAIEKNQEGNRLTFDQRVVVHAVKKLVDRSKQRPQTLGQLWSEYAEAKGIDADTREGKRYHVWTRPDVAIEKQDGKATQVVAIENRAITPRLLSREMEVL